MSTDSDADSGRPLFSTKVPDCVAKTCYEYRGVIVNNIMPPRCLDGLSNFKVRPDDVFIITWPKSGTTWVEQLALLVQFDGDISKLEGNHLLRMIPFLDIVTDFANPETSPTCIEKADAMASPRIVKSHCLPDWLPEDIRTDDPKVKVIYVARNLKDAAVSYYHFCHGYVDSQPSYESWDVFFEELLASRTPQGSWFEHVLPWWRRRNHPNVLFLKYEDMKKDLHGVVKQIAEFMGKSFSTDVIDKIAAASTFDSMRKSRSANPDFLIFGKLLENEKSFMRKGTVGDWKNYFTKEQNERFDELYKKKMAGSGLKFDFENSP